MLLNLNINNIVLIKSLSLDFKNGLSVLSGETGAGKSILLDSLGLITGARAEVRLIKAGTEKGMVSALFVLPKDHEVYEKINDLGIPLDSQTLEINIRRELSKTGSRAWINDTLVNMTSLKNITHGLIEIHGQFDTQELFDAKTHRDLLDKYGNYPQLTDKVSYLYKAWKKISKELVETQKQAEESALEEEFLRYSLEELEKFNPKQGEEEELAKQRSLLQHTEKLIEGINKATREISGSKGAEGQIRSALRSMQNVAERAENKLDDIIETLDSAAESIAEVQNMINHTINSLDVNPHALEHTEERLFAMRSLARKHNVSPFDLPKLMDEFAEKITNIEHGEEIIAKLVMEEQQARFNFLDMAKELTTERKNAGLQLVQDIKKELKPLKLENANFRVAFTMKEEKSWNKNGCEDITFEVQTNPGSDFGLIGKVASGGELSRFVLAIKSVLLKQGSLGTMIFDEVDSGVGGATAMAVGNCLYKLGQKTQVMTITHSPQVAAMGTTHYRVEKSQSKDDTITKVHILDEDQQLQEIARMISGESITQESLAAAKNLLNSKLEP